MSIVYLTTDSIYQKDIIESSIKVPIGVFDGSTIDGVTRVGFFWDNNGFAMPFGLTSYGLSSMLKY